MKSTDVVNLIYFVGFLDLLAVSMTIPMLSRHARDIGASPTVAGLISSMYGFLQLFSSPLAGRWSDVSGRKCVLLWCLFLSAVSYSLLGISTTVFLLLLARIPAGLFKHSQELTKAYLADLTPTHEHSKVFGRFNSVSSIGFVFGPVVGGHISDMTNGFYFIAIITSGIFLLNFALVWLLLPIGYALKNPTDDADDRKTKNNDNFSGFHPLEFLRSFHEVDWPNVWDIFLARFLFAFSVLVYRSDFAATLSYKYDSPGVVIGYVISYTSAVGAVSSFFVGAVASRYDDDGRLLLHTGVIQTLTMCAMTFAPNVATLALLMTPLSVSNAVARVCAVNLTLSRGGDRQKGTLMGLGASVLSLARMTSPAIGGLSQELSSSGPSVVGTVVSAAGILVLLTAAPKKASNVDKKNE